MVVDRDRVAVAAALSPVTVLKSHWQQVIADEES